MDIVHFDELTWPDVSSLPRNIPLFLPLGKGYDLTQLPEMTETNSHYLLPAIPYGWSGSELEVPADIFNRVLLSVVANLLEDGFTRVYLLAPEIALPMGIPVFHLPGNVTSESSTSDRGLEKVVILPIGHTEQHGFHAPLSTDTLIIEAIGHGTVQLVPDLAFCLPVFPYGVSTHRRSFPGTFNVGGRCFEDFWLAALDTLVERGFTRMYLISGHGGNSSFLVNVVKYAGEKYPQVFCATSFLYLSGPKGVAALDSLRRSPPGGMGHACELETSIVLHLRPDLVHLERAVDEMDFIHTPSYTMDWLESGALIANPPWEDDTRTGAYGAGSMGTAEKGELWLKVAIEEKSDHIAEIQEQYFRRRERQHKQEPRK